MSWVFIPSPPKFVATRFDEDDRCVALTHRNVPVRVEEAILFLAGHELKPVPLVEANRPSRVGPRPDQQPTLALRTQRIEQRAADALPLVGAADVGVSDQRGVAN